ncbi:MAG: hypothetical protein V8Q84_08170, partial [Bilophila sp.]
CELGAALPRLSRLAAGTTSLHQRGALPHQKGAPTASRRRFQWYQTLPCGTRALSVLVRVVPIAGQTRKKGRP